MKKREQTKKLTLEKTTIARLDDQTLNHVKGGKSKAGLSCSFWPIISRSDCP